MERPPKSFMSDNTVYILMISLIRNFYKTIIQKINAKDFGLSTKSRIKTFVFKFISVPAKWIKTSREHRLNIYTVNHAYARVFNASDWLFPLMGWTAYYLKSLYGVRGRYAEKNIKQTLMLYVEHWDWRFLQNIHL